MFNKSIYFFISVVETGSFSAAARVHYLSQSAISQQITKLESELGFLLFDRSGYRPVLTHSGEHFYKGIKKLMEDYNELEEESRYIDHDEHKELSIGITSSFERKQVLPIIMKYKELNNISTHIEMHNFNEVTQLLLKRKLDLAFGIDNDFKRYSELNYYDLYTFKTCIICSKAHPLSNKKQVYVKDIENEKIISLSRNVGHGFYKDFMNSFRLDGMKPHIIKEVDNLDEFLISVKMNEGIAFTSTEVVDDEALSTIELLDSHHHSQFAVAYHKDNKKSYIPPLIDLLIEEFKAL